MRHRIQAFALICLAASYIFFDTHSAAAVAQAPVEGGEKEPAPTEKPKTVNLNELTFPPGSVLILVEEIRKLANSKYWIDGATYKKMRDRLAELERILQAKTTPAHACRLTATVKGDYVLCHASYTFFTKTPDSRVFLGLKGVNFTEEGSLDDDDIPLLSKTKKGFDVRVMKPGLHKLTISFTVPLRLTPQMEQERSFEFGLPGAAVTTLVLNVPEAIDEIRWNGKDAKRPDDGPWQLPIGTADNLIVLWKHPATIVGATPRLTAAADLEVMIGQASIRIKSDCVLRDLTGKTTEWKLQLPTSAQIKMGRINGVSASIIAPTKNKLTHIVKLEKPTATPIPLTITWTAPRTGKSTAIALGPMRVLGASQEGRINVRAEANVAPTTRYEYDFAKSNAVPALPGAKSSHLYHWSSSDGALPLRISIREEIGKLETRVDHVIHAFKIRNGWQFELATTIHGRVLQGTFDHIDVRLPRSNWNGLGAYAVGSSVGSWAALPWGIWLDPMQYAVVIAEPMELEMNEPGYEMRLADDGATRLTFPAQKKTFQIVLRGKFTVGPDWVKQVQLPLPVPIGTLSRSGKITAQLENTLAFARPDSAVPFRDDPHRLKSSHSTPPRHVMLQWQEHRPDLEVAVVSDVTVEKSHVSIRQTIDIPITTDREFLPGRQTNRAPFRLTGPKAVLADLTRISGGRLLRDAAGDDVWVELPKDVFDRHQLTLEYDIPLPKSDGAGHVVLETPLILPEHTTRVSAKARFWTPRGVLPQLSTGAKDRNKWKERRLEQVADHSSLPSLVLTGAGKTLPLSITLTQPEQLRLPQIVIDRALIQVTINDNAFQHSARFSIAKVNTQFVDVQLPGPVAQTLLRITLNGKGVNHWQIVGGQPNTVRIHLDSKLFPGRFILEIDYEVSASQAQSRGWQTTFFAPIFRGEVFVNRLRWQLPMNYQRAFFVASSDVRANVDWQFRDGLWIPKGEISPAQLDRWLTGAPSETGDSAQGVVLDATKLDALRVLHFSKPSWLFLCSGVVLAAGLGLFFAPFSRWAFWIAAIILGAGVVAVVAWWPTLTTAVLYGVQPGVAVLVVVFASYWGWREWHRRKTVFMPGFTRTPHASSVVRKNNVQSKSTVDAPRPSGVSSSAN